MLYLAREEVEMCGVEFVGLGKVGHTHAEVAELMHGSRPLLEALEGINWSVFLLRLHNSISMANTCAISPR